MNISTVNISVSVAKYLVYIGVRVSCNVQPPNLAG